MTSLPDETKSKLLLAVRAASSGNSIVLHKSLQDWDKDCGAWFFVLLSEAALDNWNYFKENEVALSSDKARAVIVNLMSTQATSLAVFNALNRITYGR